jgi:hypothetical protein
MYQIGSREIGEDLLNENGNEQIIFT